MRMQNLKMELNKPSSRREQERALGGDQLEMARPTCNFIRHTLTFFSRFFSPPECPKGEIPASGRRPELGWTAYTRKGTNLSFGKSSYLYHCMRAVMHFPSFLDWHQLHPACPALHLTRHLPPAPLSSSPSVLNFIPHPALLQVWNRSVVQQINTLAHASLTAFPHPCPFHSPAPWFPMQTCSSLCFILSGFPVSSVILGCSSLEPSFVYIYVKGRRPIEPCRMNSLMHNDDGGTRLSAVRFSDLGCPAWV